MCCDIMACSEMLLMGRLMGKRSTGRRGDKVLDVPRISETLVYLDAPVCVWAKNDAENADI